MSSFGIRRTLQTGYEEALARVPEALKAEGFGVLTEIDMQSTLKEKLGVDFRRYRILGACNPPFALEALEAEPEVGLLLPCNVVVYEEGPNQTVVTAIDPMKAMGESGNPRLSALAEKVKARLTSALDRL